VVIRRPGSKTDATGKLKLAMPKLELLGIDDAEKFCSAIATKCGSALSWHERQDLEQYLLVECWTLSLSFKPGQASFSTYAARRLRLRVTDWERQRRGRTTWRFKDRVYERKLPELVSFDDDRLEQALATNNGDPAADRLEDDRGLYAARDQFRAQDLEQLGAETPRPR
jgi:hypothetical protein